MLWTTIAIAMALAYLRRFGAEACVTGFEVAGVALVVGLLVGKATNQVKAGVFWSMVGAMFGYLSAAGAPAIPGDVDDDGDVDINDLLDLLAAWGPCAKPCPPCAADFNDDCIAGINDLLILLANWT